MRVFVRFAGRQSVRRAILLLNERHKLPELLTYFNYQTQMTNHYETAFILTPVLSEPQMKEAVSKFSDLLAQNGGTVIEREEWGLRKLAYPIQGKTTGFYALLQFDAEPAVIATLETEFRRDERVIRFLTTRLDKYAYQYSEKRRGGKKNVEPANQEEA